MNWNTNSLTSTGQDKNSQIIVKQTKNYQAFFEEADIMGKKTYKRKYCRFWIDEVTLRDNINNIG